MLMVPVVPVCLLLAKRSWVSHFASSISWAELVEREILPSWNILVSMLGHGSPHTPQLIPDPYHLFQENVMKALVSELKEYTKVVTEPHE